MEVSAMRSLLFPTLAPWCLFALFPATLLHAEPTAAEQEKVVEKALTWLVRNQHRDGHWEAQGGQYPVTMTSLVGMALLMEGSTPAQGKYQDNINRAIDYLIAHSTKQQQGTLLADLNQPGDQGRYMFSHGYAMLFLSNVLGEIPDRGKQQKVAALLEEGVKFTAFAQTERDAGQFGKVGGWGYISARDGNNFDEGAVTIVNLHGLIAAKKAGVPIPEETLRRGLKYLEAATGNDGGVIYSLTAGGGGGRPALTTGAVSCWVANGTLDSPVARKWLVFCKKSIALPGARSSGHDAFTHFYHAPALYALGENGWGKLFPEDKKEEALTWSKYRQAFFNAYKASQQNDGSWNGGYVGPVYETAVHACVLQLDKKNLPLFQR
jgi:hypothetical protein